MKLKKNPTLGTGKKNKNKTKKPPNQPEIVNTSFRRDELVQAQPDSRL